MSGPSYIVFGGEAIPIGSGTPGISQLVNTLSTLAVTGPNEAVTSGGYASIGDGGGDLFVWNNTDTRTSDGGTIIAVSGVATGRWNRVVFGPFSVKWFGAKGDGSTDDTAAIKATITAAVASGAQGVFFPSSSSKYVVSSTITLTSGNMLFAGEGPSVEIHQSTLNTDLFSDGGNAISNLQFEHLFLSGQGVSSTGMGIHLTGGGSGHKFIDVQMGTVGSDTAFAHGIHLVNCPSAIFVGCAIWQCVYGLILEASSNASLIEGCQFRVHTNTAIWMTSGTSPELPLAGGTIHACRFEENTQYAIWLDTVSSVLVSGCYFESQGIYAVTPSWDIYLSDTAQPGDPDRPFANAIVDNAFRGSNFTTGLGGDYFGSVWVHAGKQNVIRGGTFVTNAVIQIDSGALNTYAQYPMIFDDVTLTNNGANSVIQTLSLTDFAYPVITMSTPSAGAAMALPATPAGYATVQISGAAHKIAYY